MAEDIDHARYLFTKQFIGFLSIKRRLGNEEEKNKQNRDI